MRYVLADGVLYALSEPTYQRMRLGTSAGRMPVKGWLEAWIGAKTKGVKRLGPLEEIYGA